MKIGLTFTGYGEKHQNYVKWLKGRDRDIDVIKLTAEGDPQEIRGCDALVLSGGVDIHPALYNGPLVYPKSDQAKGWKRRRDDFERSVFDHAMERDLPILGVCRGLQLINVLLQGTLIQDLGEGDARHESVGDMDRVHPVTLEAGSLLYEIGGRDRGEANSAHHQAIGRLGEGLMVNSRADDGTIEGIEWQDKANKPWMLAVQWHPERMFTNKFPDRHLYAAIRDRFIAEAKQRKS
ncbi:MAG: gamma-glutamyl-gamma-aminobutyrate hydrolase family protein [Bacteroidota bacterium]|nr:gamma-glutamyl-gamma-aminobutyrate hydrolase family protein [Bacteroidota bacterium]MDP4215119.1 gamma-glutamyl-gamma-aminobutyrate hydrolase family protein [Bacteroidota bacterium]MDP4247248.1 gamma-glutamyl-gamma-aminobutyrate hydrolase family protein [Bacteroidota bacterium]MDP4259461.1 gamma-glutamyl-gamma-aminobutyrate hydrolase family protein [Bacteroidota bacterium]